MHARVATWEGVKPEDARKMADGINAEDGPPEGVPGVAFTMLHNESGKVLAIGLFETEEDLRTGDAKLNEMSPPVDLSGKRVSVEFFEVGVKVEA